MRRLFVSILTVLTIGSAAQANDFAVAVGLRSNSADSTGTSWDATTSFQAGVLGFWDFSEVLGVRAGFMYTERNFETSGVKVTLGYADIPATLTVKVADYAHMFIGPVFALNASHKISGAAAPAGNPDSMSVGLQLGASFKFAPQFGGELFYEMLPGDLWTGGLKDAKTVGANLLITFE